ncbi:MFS transporter [Streptomyces millisiae]|uniref:MFS transporter n=1 Tax=Streptomyces millisiae TaxID=3075542 RepID=A0ABU2LHM7_9ACTN|nr:MFS transporter [Streptomyces sp. DSM 44918]MDT0317085.1 MFS transporter [Streptomyces sp. DSM 44918]
MTITERNGVGSPAGPRRRERFGFVAAVVSLVGVFVASGAPIPLYERYRSAGGLSTADLSLAAVSYFIAVMSTLIVLGRISDHLGRRPVGLAAVILAAAGCLTLLDVTGLPVLVAGRVLHGVACGLGSSAIAAYAVDLAPRKPTWLAAAAPAGAPLVGLTIGAVGSGALAEHAPAPALTPHLTATVLLTVCAALLLASPDPVTWRPGVLTSLRPKVLVPASIRPLLPAAVAVFCGTWALGGFYQAFSPTIAAHDLGTSDALVAGIVFASFMAPYALGGPLTGRLAPLTAQRTGIVVFALAVAGIVAGLYTGTIALVIACGVVAATGQGAAFTGTLHALLARVEPTERAGLMSTVYLVSYGGAALPSLIAGRLAGAGLELSEIAIGYAGLATLAAVIVLTRPRLLGTSDQPWRLPRQVAGGGTGPSGELPVRRGSR